MTKLETKYTLGTGLKKGDRVRLSPDGVRARIGGRAGAEARGVVVGRCCSAEDCLRVKFDHCKGARVIYVGFLAYDPPRGRNFLRLPGELLGGDMSRLQTGQREAVAAERDE
jgi:hypothetical protein